MAAALQTTCNNQNTLCTPCSFSKARRFKEFGGKWRDNRQAAVARIATETYREGQLNVATSPFIAMEERGLNLVGPHCTSPSRQALAQKCTTTTFVFILGFLPFLSFLVRHSSSQTCFRQRLWKRSPFYLCPPRRSRQRPSHPRRKKKTHGLKRWSIGV